MNESLLNNSLLLTTPRKTQPVQAFTPKSVVKPKLIQKSDVVQTFVRLKPEFIAPSDQKLPVEVIDNHTIRVEKGNTNRCFPFHEVFDENATQKEVYEATALSCVTNIFSGVRSLIFAYGATGTGKTHTMIGSCDENKVNEHGIILRLLDDVLKELNSRRKENPELCIYLNFIENSHLGTADLLNDYEHCKKGPRDSMLSTYSTCSIRSTTSTKSNNHKSNITINQSNFTVEGLIDVEVNEIHEAINLVSYGLSKRKVRCTKLNSDSSRSHALFFINLGRKVAHNNTISVELLNRISVIDLAGNEKSKEAHATKQAHIMSTKDRVERENETTFINTTLFHFTTAISQLKQNGIAQFRNSDLNRLVANDFGKNGSKVFAILTLSKNPERIHESLGTVNFSTNLQGLKTIDLEDGRLVQNKNPPPENPELKMVLTELKNEKIARQEDEFKIREQVLREAEFSLQMRDSAAIHESMTIRSQLQNKIDVARKETQLYFQKYEQAITHKEYYKNKLATFQAKLEDQNLIIGKLQIERDEYKEKLEAVRSDTDNGSLISEKLRLELEATNEQLQAARREKENIERSFYARTQQYESDKRGTIDRYEQEKRNIYESAKQEIETLRNQLKESEARTEKQREYIRLLKEKTAQLIQAQQEEKKESSSILSKFSSIFSSKNSKQSKEDVLQLNIEESSDLKRKHDLKEDERSKVESPNKKVKVEEGIENEESEVVPTKKRTKRRFLKK